MSFFSKKLAIDLGSANTCIYLKDRGIVLNEPSCVAINYWEKKAIAVGHDAKFFMGKTPQHIKAFRPLKDGILADFPSTKEMLVEFYKKIFGKKNKKSKAVFIIPSTISAEEKKNIRAIAGQVGCGRLFLLPEPLAAALGAGLDISANRGRIIINIGGSICEIAVVINSTVTFSRVTSFAGDAVDDAIIRHLNEKYGVHIGENTAEKCKEAIGAALCPPGHSFSLIGKDKRSNSPRAIEVESTALQQAIRAPLDVLDNFIKDSLAKIGAQHIKDAREDGILLVGGGCLLRGLDTFLAESTGLDMVRSEEPLLSVIKGGGMALEKRFRYRKLFM